MAGVEGSGRLAFGGGGDHRTPPTVFIVCLLGVVEPNPCSGDCFHTPSRKFL